MKQPLNLLKLAPPIVDSIQIASEYYDRKIFDRHTFGELIKLGTRPLIIINATDMARKQTFTFRQVDFDVLGLDLSSVPIEWATAASSVLPILLSPMRLHYHPGEPMRAAIENLPPSTDVSRVPNRKRWARSLFADGEEYSAGVIAIDAQNYKHLYLLDGGLADNLGLHSLIEAFRSGLIRERFNNGRIKRLVVMIVDDGTEPSVTLEREMRARLYLQA